MRPDKMNYLDFLKSYTNRGTGEMGVRDGEDDQDLGIVKVAEAIEESDGWNCPVKLGEMLTAAQDKLAECGVNQQCKSHWTEIEHKIYDRLQEVKNK